MFKILLGLLLLNDSFPFVIKKKKSKIEKNSTWGAAQNTRKIRRHHLTSKRMCAHVNKLLLRDVVSLSTKQTRLSVQLGR